MRSKAAIVAALVIVFSVQLAEACHRCGYAKCVGSCKTVEPIGGQYFGVYATEEGAPPNVVVRYWKGGVEYVRVKQQCTKDKDHETGWCWKFIPKQEYTYAQPKSYVPYAQQGTTVYGQINETSTYGHPTYQSYAAAYTTDPASFMNQAFRLVSQAQSVAQQGQSDYTANAAALNANALEVEKIRAVSNGFVAAMAATKTTPDTVNRTTTFQAATGPAGQIEQPQVFTAQGGATVAKCAGCHSTNPQAQAAMSFSNLAALNADQRMQAINAIVSDRMPKAPGQPLTPDEAAAIVKELSQPPVAAGQKF